MTLNDFNKLSEKDKREFQTILSNDTNDFINSTWFISEKLNKSLYDAYTFIKSYKNKTV